MMLACTWSSGLVGSAQIAWNDWMEMELGDRDFLLAKIVELKDRTRAAASSNES